MDRSISLQDGYFIEGWIDLFHCMVGISLRAGCIYFIVGWVFHWGLDAFISLGDGYFIRGWVFHWKMGISLEDG